MSGQALALVLTAALLHALWNIAAKKAGGDSRFALMTSLLILVLWAPVGVWAGWRDAAAWSPSQMVNCLTIILASGLIHLVYFNTLLRGYRLSDLTVVYPVARGSGPLLSSAGAVLILGEHMGALGVAGVLGVCFGVFLIAGGPGLWKQAHDPAKRQRLHTGLRYGAMTGALIAGYTLVDGYAVKVMLISPIVIDYFGNAFRLPFLLPTLLRDPNGFKHAWRAQWRYALLVAAISPLGYVLVLYAVQMAPLSHVAPAREVSMLFATLLGGKLLGEGERGWRLAGAACIAAGVVSLATG